jgi:predicted esterase
MEALDSAQHPEVYVMRGGVQGPGKLVFLHGMCGHGLGYAQAFQYSAAKKGTLIAPQGDVSCGGPWSKWSGNIAALDARIQDTFRRLGATDPIVGVVVMGMSQGATRAEALARAYPERYTRLISMAAPTSLRQFDLRHLESAVLMAGERDRRDLMKASEQALKAGGVPAKFMLIPEATHGAMGPTPERTMGAALDWLWGNARTTK